MNTLDFIITAEAVSTTRQAVELALLNHPGGDAILDAAYSSNGGGMNGLASALAEFLTLGSICDTKSHCKTLRSVESALAGHPKGKAVFARTPPGEGLHGLHGTARLMWLTLEMAREVTGQQMNVDWKPYKTMNPHTHSPAAKRALPGVHISSNVPPGSNAAAGNNAQKLEAVRKQIAEIPKFDADPDEAARNSVKRAELCRQARVLRGDGEWQPGTKE